MGDRGYFEGIIIAISLSIALGIAAVNIAMTKMSTNQISRKMVRISSEVHDVNTLKSKNEKVITGSEAVNLIKLYSDSYPFMLVTPVLYENYQISHSVPMYSFDAIAALDEKAAEYINPLLNYHCIVYCDKYGNVECVQFIEKNISANHDIVHYKDAIAEYNSAETVQKATQSLIEKQFELYDLER